MNCESEKNYISPEDVFVNLNDTYIAEKMEELDDGKSEIEEESKEHFFSKTKNELLKQISEWNKDFAVTNLEDLEEKRIKLLGDIKDKNEKGIFGLLKISNDLLACYEVILNKYEELNNLSINERDYTKKKLNEEYEAMKSYLFQRLEYYELESIQALLDIIPGTDAFLKINIKLKRASKILAFEPELKELFELRKKADFLNLIPKSEEENIKIYLNELYRKTKIESVDELNSRITLLQQRIETLAKQGKKVLEKQNQFELDELNEFKEQSLKLNSEKLLKKDLKVEPSGPGFAAVSISVQKTPQKKPDTFTSSVVQNKKKAEPKNVYSEILQSLGNRDKYQMKYWEQLTENYSIHSFNDLEKSVKKTENLKKNGDPEGQIQSYLDELMAYSKISKDFNIYDNVTKQNILSQIEENLKVKNLDEFLNKLKLQKIENEQNKKFHKDKLEVSESKLKILNYYYQKAKEFNLIDTQKEKKNLIADMKEEKIDLNELDEAMEYYFDEIKNFSAEGGIGFDSENEKKYALFSYFKNQAEKLGLKY